MNSADLQKLIETIAKNLEAIGDARTRIVEVLENTFDGDGNFDFTWLFAKDWAIDMRRKDGQFILFAKDRESVWLQDRVSDEEARRVAAVWREIHPAYVFAKGYRIVGSGSQPFIAVLRTDNEKKE